MIPGFSFTGNKKPDCLIPRQPGYSAQKQAEPAVFRPPMTRRLAFSWDSIIKAFPGQPSVLIEGLECVCFFAPPLTRKWHIPATAKEKVPCDRERKGCSLNTAV
jgi:hypothetical protein